MFAILYVLIAIIGGVIEMIRISVAAGISMILASILAFAATGGTIVALRAGERWAHRVGSPLFGIVLAGLALWLSTKFSVYISGWHISGMLWVLIGFIVGITLGLRSNWRPSVS